MLKFNAPFSGTQVEKEAEGESQQAGNKFEFSTEEMSNSVQLYLAPRKSLLLKVSHCWVRNDGEMLDFGG